MKTNLIFFLGLIFCSQVTSTLFESKETTMEYIVSELAELNEIAGKDKLSTQVLLSKLRKCISGVAKASKSAFGTILSNCKAGTGKLTSFIKKLKGDLAADNAKRLLAGKKLAVRRKKCRAYRGNLMKGAKSLRKIEARIRTERSNRAKFNTEATGKLDVCKRIEDIIRDELLEEEQKKIAPKPKKAAKKIAPKPKKAAKKAAKKTSKKAAFIQMDNAIQELKEKLGNEQDIMITPLVSALLSLTTDKKYSNQKILKKILRLLGKIKGNLRKFLKNQGKNYAKIIKQIKKQAKQIRGQHRNYYKLYADCHADVKYIIRHRVFLGENAAALRTHIAAKSAELKRWSGLCAHQTSFYAGIQKSVKKGRNAIKAITSAINK